MLDSNQREHRARLTTEFLRELTKAAQYFRWYVDQFGQIRAEHPDYAWTICPLTAVGMVATGRPYRVTQAHDVADELGLADISLRLVEAMDHRNPHSTLRANILRAVDLKSEI